MTTDPSVLHSAPAERRHTLERRIDATTWGLLLLMTGVLMFLPERVVPEGAWLIAAGAILLVMSAVRRYSGLKTSALVIALGVVGVLGGISSAAGLHFRWFAAFLVVVGASIVLHSWVTRGEE